jgi:hypothetical protein
MAVLVRVRLEPRSIGPIGILSLKLALAISAGRNLQGSSRRHR